MVFLNLLSKSLKLKGHVSHLLIKVKYERPLKVRKLDYNKELVQQLAIIIIANFVINAMIIFNYSFFILLIKI